MKSRSIALISALALALCALNIQAQTVIWTNTTGGSWNVAVNWSPNIVPASNNDVIIDQPGVTVSLANASAAGSITLGTNSGGTVALSLANQTLTLYGTLQVNASGSFTVDSGALSGVSGAGLTGPIGWTAGALSGVLGLSPTCTLTINGGTLQMNGTVLTNRGTINWTNGTIESGSGAVINNYGLWNMQSDQTINNAFGGAGAMFNNFGTVRKSGGGPEFSNATYFASGVVFNQLAGILDVQNGVSNAGTQLDFQGGGTFSGGYITTNQLGLTVLSQGNFGINGTVTGTNTWEDAGELVGTNVISGALTWVGGNWNGASSVTITTNSTLIIGGGTGVNDFNGCQVTNQGTVLWNSGQLRSGNGGTVVNNGLWNMTTNLALNNAYGGAGVTFDNSGTFRQSGGGPEFSNATYIASGVVFNQLAGIIDAQNGPGNAGTQIDFQGGGTFSGGYITTNQFGLTVLSQGNFTINGAVTGTNTWEDAGELVGTNVISGALTWVGGNWNGASSVTITPNSTLIIGGGTGVNDFNGCQVTNQGTVLWNSGQLRSGNGGTVVNNGLWNMTTNLTLNDAYGGAGVTFDNMGTLRQSGGGPEFSNATYFASGVAFNQLAGVIDAQNGPGNAGTQIDFQGGGTWSGGYVATNQFGLVLLSAGNFNLNGTVTTTNTWEDAASLTGTNIIRGGLTWVGGSWNNTIVTLNNESTLIINTPSGTHTMGGCLFTNNGTVDWSGDQLYAGDGSVVYNNGVWIVQDDQIFNNYYGGPGALFYNSATFQKNGGSPSNQTYFNNVTFDQAAGTLNIQTGNLTLTGTQNLTGGSATGPGSVLLSSGSFTVNGTVTTTNVYDTGSAMAGTNVINGALTWQAGSWNNATVTVSSNSLVAITTPSGKHTLGGAALTNFGTVTWSADELYAGNGSIVDNYGQWIAQDDQIFNNYYGGPGAFFNNYGTFLKTGGTTSNATVFNAVNFSQISGVINPGSGNIEIGGTINLTGGSVPSASGSILLNNGSFTVNGTTTTTNVYDAGSVMAGTNVITGGLTWQAGSWNSATVTVSTNSLLVINTASGQHTLGGTVFNNNGTVKWSADELYAGNGSILNNNGLWLAQDNQIFNNYYGGPGAFLNNAGIFRKTGTNGTTTLQGGITLANTGTIDCQTGAISIQGTYNLTNGTLNTGITSLTNYGAIVFSGAVNLAGTISANLNGTYLPSVGDAFTNIYYGSFGGAFNKFVPPNADSWTTNYTPTAFYLRVIQTVAAPIPLLNPQIVSNQFTFNFSSVNGQSYTVQDTTNLANTKWAVYTNIIGGGAVYQFAAPASNVPALFYRVVQP